MRTLSLRLPAWVFTSVLAVGLAMASHLTPTWSQLGDYNNASTLPPLPNSAPSNPSLPKAASVPNDPNGNFPSMGSYAPGIAVIGQSHVAATSTHLMSSATLSNGSQQLVVFDPSRLTLVVYHIEPNKGDVQLKSVRRMDADFSLEEFNLSEPTPSTIRKNLRPNP